MTTLDETACFRVCSRVADVLWSHRGGDVLPWRSPAVVRNGFSDSEIAALRNFTDPPVNFLQLCCSIAPGQLENFSGYAVALLQGCRRKFTDGSVKAQNSRRMSQQSLWLQITEYWRRVCKDVSQADSLLSDLRLLCPRSAGQPSKGIKLISRQCKKYHELPCKSHFFHIFARN